MRAGASVIFAAGLAFAAMAGAVAQPRLAEPSAPARPSAAALSSAPPQPQAAPYPTAADAPETGVCEAKNLAWLVGKPRSAIPVPVYPGLRRVYCSTCLVTQDYIPRRTDIVFDNETGVITAVICG